MTNNAWICVCAALAAAALPAELDAQVRLQHAVTAGTSDLTAGGWAVGSRHRARGFPVEIGTMLGWKGLGGLAYVSFPSPFGEPPARIQADTKMFFAVGIGRRFDSSAPPEYGWGQWLQLAGVRYWPLSKTGGFFELALGGFRTVGVPASVPSTSGVAGHFMAGFAF